MPRSRPRQGPARGLVLSTLSSFSALLAVIALGCFIPWELAERSDRRNPAVVSPPVRHRVRDDADGRRAPVQHDPTDPAASANGFGYTATFSGLALMPGGLAMLAMMPIAGGHRSLSAEIPDGGRLMRHALQCGIRPRLRPPGFLFSQLGAGPPDPWRCRSCSCRSRRPPMAGCCQTKPTRRPRLSMWRVTWGAASAFPSPMWCWRNARNSISLAWSKHRPLVAGLSNPTRVADDQVFRGARRVRRRRQLARRWA